MEGREQLMGGSTESATDPGSTRDFQAFARQTGNELVEQTNSGDEFVHVLRRR